MTHNKLVLTHFVEGDDIEAFLMTFECLMAVYHIEESRCIETLVPQLSGRAQHAYGAMTAEADTSDGGVGAVLSQYDENDKNRPIAYFSRKLLPRE